MVKYTRVPLGHILYKIGVPVIKSSRAIYIRRRSKSLATTNVQIDLAQFANGYDPNVNKGYHTHIYDRLGKKPDAKKQLSKIGHAKHAKAVFNSWLKAKKGDKGRSGKQVPYFQSALTKVKYCLHDFGECLLGAANKTKSGFKCRFLNKKGSDGYIHHVSVLANSQCGTPIHELSLIKKVSQDKREDGTYSISHLCGNGGCARPGHLIIESKLINDERVGCHRFLRRCKSARDALTIRKLCPHSPKCFTNLYINIDNYY